MDMVLDFIRLIWKNKVLISIITGSAIVITVVILLLLPTKFTARVVILPPTGGSSVPSSLAGLIGSFSGGSSMEGTISVGLYPTIFLSRTILEPVLNSDFKGKKIKYVLTNSDSLSRKEMDILYNQLQGMVMLSINGTNNSVVLRFESEDPEFAAFFLNSIIDQVDYFFRYRLRSSARDQRDLLEKRLVEVQDSLQHAETALYLFRDSNKSISGSPALQMREQQLLMNYTIQSTIYTELIKQRELTKLQEIRDSAILQVLERAHVPGQKSFPMRRKILVAITFVVVVLSMLFVKLRDLWFVRVSPSLEGRKAEEEE